MKIGKYKDGGNESNVTGWFVEAKSFLTLALLRFAPGSREAFHSHAFNCVSLLLKGTLVETFLDGSTITHKAPKLIITRQRDLHKVYSVGTSWVFTLRGPWNPFRSWYEVRNAYEPLVGLYSQNLVRMGDGRKEECVYSFTPYECEQAVRQRGLRTTAHEVVQ